MADAKSTIKDDWGAANTAMNGPGFGSTTTTSTSSNPFSTSTSGASVTSAQPAPFAASSEPQSFNLSGLQAPTTRTVDPKTQTVAGQLESVIATDNPLMQQARTRALQAQNTNGTLNSSMAVGAAQSALYDKGLQIASPDAAIYNNAADRTYDAQNNFISANNTQTRQKEMADIQQGYGRENKALDSAYEVSRMREADELAARQAKEDVGYKQTLMQTQFGLDTLTNAQKAQDLKAIADIEASYKNMTQGSASAAAVVTNMQAQIGQLYANKDLTEANRTAMIGEIKANAASAMQMIGALAGDADLQDFINGIWD